MRKLFSAASKNKSDEIPDSDVIEKGYKKRFAGIYGGETPIYSNGDSYR